MSILKEWRLVVYHKTTKFPKILDNKRKKNTWIMPIFESFCTIEQEWKFKRGGKGEKERWLAGRKSLLPFLGQRLWDMLKEEKWVEANIKAIRPFGEVPKRCLKRCEKHRKREREREEICYPPNLKLTTLNRYWPHILKKVVSFKFALA